MKNPWMSMWMSAANTMAGPARGLIVAETRRVQNAAVEEMTRQTMAFWFPAMTRQPAPKRRRRTKR